VSIIGDAISWLADGDHWRGSSSLPGIPALLGDHLQITAISVAAGIALAVPLGLLLGHAHRGGGVITLLGNLLRAIPTLGLLILLTSPGALGFSTLTSVVALAVFAVPPLLTYTYTGMVGVDPDTVEAARGMGLSPLQVLTRVELPLALPLIAAGLRTAALQVFATATLVAYVGGTTLGSIINLGNGSNDQGEVFAGGIIVAVLALVADGLFGLLQAVVTPGPEWGTRLARRRRRLAARAATAAGR